MKKILMMIAALAMTTMFAQANEEATTQEQLAQAVQEATDAVPAQEDDKNATQEETPAPAEEK